jgi:transcription elongation factor GreB
MSKAFLRESDTEDLPARPPPVSLLPPGARNLVTPDGAERLRATLKQLVEIERPPLAAKAHDPDEKRALAALDQRIRQLEQSVRTAEIVAPPSPVDEIVRFGARVTVRDRAGAEAHYRIVGVDETDLVRGWISWQSPLAQALLNARRGQPVSFQAPSGRQDLEIVDVRYS